MGSEEYISSDIENLKLHAERGDADAQYYAGVFYYAGLDIDSDLNEAAFWLKKSANQGHRLAQFSLSMIIMKRVKSSEQGRACELADAQYWYERSLEDNCELFGDVLKNLSFSHDFEIPKDLHCVFDIFGKVQPDLCTQNNMAVLLFCGLLVPRNAKLALTLFEAAADKGNVESIVNLGVIYSYIMDEDAAQEEAFRLFKKAALAGMPKAQFLLGYSFETGMGVNMDYGLALKWIKKSAAGGYVDAIKHLDSLLVRGIQSGPTIYGSSFTERTIGKVKIALAKLLS